MSVIWPRNVISRRHLSRQLTIFSALTVGILAAWVLAAVALTGNAAAETPPAVTYTDYEIELDLADNGDLAVRVRQQARFDGQYSDASLNIPKAYANGIEVVGVYVASEKTLSPADFAVTDQAEFVNVSWTFPPTKAGDVREFVIEYAARGALWVYNERDVLRWGAVHADRRGAPVESARVSVRLPSYVPLESVQFKATGADYVAEIVGEKVVFRTNEPVSDGQFFNVEVDFPHGLINAKLQNWQKEADSELLDIAIPRLETELWIRPDGTLSVRERLDVAVLNSVLYGGHRDIAHLYLDGVTNLRVFQDNLELPQSTPPCEQCLWIDKHPRSKDWIWYSEDADSVVVDESLAGRTRADWDSTPVYAGDTTTFVIEYDVIGAVKPGEQEQSFTWRPAPDYGVPIAKASVRIHPPTSILRDAMVVTNTVATTPQRTARDGSIFFRSLEEIAPDAKWSIYVELPPRATAASPPLWLAEKSRALADARAAQTARAQRRLALLVLSIFALFGLVFAGIYAWFKWGRRRVREALSGYLSEPPSALAPGLVAYLVDNEVRPTGILASFIQLGSMKLVKISLQPEFLVTPLYRDKLDLSWFEIRGQGNDGLSNQHLALLYNDILLPATSGKTKCSISDMKPYFSEKLTAYFAAMARDARAYGLESQKTNVLDTVGPIVLMTVWITVTAGIAVLSLQYQIPSSILIALVLAIFALFFWFHARRQMRSGSRSWALGEAERRKWFRFRRYLANIKKFGSRTAARRIVAEHLAYAVALGVEEPVLARTDRQSFRFPSWITEPKHGWVGNVSAKTETVVQNRQVPIRKSVSVPARRTVKSMFARPGAGRSQISQRLCASLAVANQELDSILKMPAGAAAGRRVIIRVRGRNGETALEWDERTPLGQIGSDLLRRTTRRTGGGPAGSSRSGWVRRLATSTRERGKQAENSGVP